MEMWDKLDEVIGVGALSVIACFAMYIQYNSGVVSVCAAGIITILATGVGARAGKEGKK